MAEPLFLFPPDLRYACMQHGDCCRNSWDIPVEEKARQRLENLDWRSCSNLADSAPAPVEKSRRLADTHVLCRVDGACHFLKPSGRCALHGAHGEEAKPLACRRFPYQFTQTPAGVYVGFSYACKAVRRQEGPLVQETGAAAVADIFAARDDWAEVKESLGFDGELSLDWREYGEIEAILDGLFSREEETVETVLIAGHVWLSLLKRTLQMARYQFQGQADETAAGKKVLARFLEKSREEGCAKAIEIARKPVSNSALKRVLLGAFLSFRNGLRPRQSRLEAMVRLSFSNMRHWARLGGFPLKPLDRSVPYRRLQASANTLADDATQALLRRYFRHCLFRKDLVRQTELFWGYNWLVLMYGLIQNYAAGLEAIGEGDGERALELVESWFGYHSNFNQTLLYHPAVAHTFQYAFGRPNFAHTLVRG